MLDTLSWHSCRTLLLDTVVGHWHPASQITHTDTSSANAKITAVTQITHTDTSSANADTTAAAQITLTDASSANTNITAAAQITLTDTSSANAKIIAATRNPDSDTSWANINITAAARIPGTDTSSANAHIAAATQIIHTDKSFANTNVTAATQMSDTDTSSANAITAAITSQLDNSGPLQTHSPMWRAFRRSRKRCERLRTVANGCGHRHNFSRTQPHPHTPKWNGNPRYAFGKKHIDGHKKKTLGSRTLDLWASQLPKTLPVRTAVGNTPKFQCPKDHNKVFFIFNGPNQFYIVLESSWVLHDLISILLNKIPGCWERWNGFLVSGSKKPWDFTWEFLSNPALYCCSIASFSKSDGSPGASSEEMKIDPPAGCYLRAAVFEANLFWSLHLTKISACARRSVVHHSISISNSVMLKSCV